VLRCASFITKYSTKGLVRLSFFRYASALPWTLLLIRAWRWVQTARFKEFWNEAARNRDILEVIPGMPSSARFGILPSSHYI
jgi:hypothetical protein